MSFDLGSSRQDCSVPARSRRQCRVPVQLQQIFNIELRQLKSGHPDQLKQWLSFSVFDLFKNSWTPLLGKSTRSHVRKR